MAFRHGLDFVTDGYNPNHVIGFGNHVVLSWSSIDWPRCFSNLNRLISRFSVKEIGVLRIVDVHERVGVFAPVK